MTATPAGGRMRHLCRTAVRWLKAAVGYRESAVAMFDLGAYGPEITERLEANLRAFRAYRPDRLRAPLTLFRAEAQPLSHLALDATLGWSSLVDGKVTVRIVPGNHHSIRTEPLVRHLACALSDVLDDVQGVNRAPRKVVSSQL
jgi:hypothetical protein